VSLNEARIVEALGELAELGSRIGERAGELARIVRDKRGTTSPREAGVAADVLGAAAEIGATVDLIAAAAHPPVDHRQTADRRRSSAGSAPGRAGRRGRRSSARSAAVRGSRATREGSQFPRRPKALWPVVASIMLHVLVVAGLALIFVTVDAPADQRVITLGMAEPPLEEEAAVVEMPSAEQPVEEATDAGGRPAAPDLLADEPVSIPEPNLSPESAAVPILADTVGPVDLEAIGAAGVSGLGGPEGEGDGDRGSRGAGAARQGGPTTTFFGRTGQGGNVCFVCDNSNSYRDGGFHAVLDEVARAVDGLRPDQSFFVIFFSDAAYPLLHPRGLDSLQQATPENKRTLRAWLETVEMCRGGRGIHEAVRLAGSLNADAIYLLSDGQLGSTVVDHVKAADVGGAVVHTIGIQRAVGQWQAGQPMLDRLREQQGWNQNMIDIATAHRGTFTPVTIPPEAAVFERLRPIPRNRARGGVWGLKL
jgi:hypothetical protein